MKNHAMKSTLLFLTLSVSLLISAHAQIPADKDGLLNGEGMEQANYAEKNGYPGPKHVLDLADKLNLRSDQKKEIQMIYNEMLTRAKEIGKEIVRIEGELNQAFQYGLLSEKAIQSDTEDIGRLRGKLRSVHLIAHLRTSKVLTEEQIRMYRKLRTEETK
jgi:hypothetical protein